MKQKLRLFMSMLLMAVCGVTWAAETVVYTFATTQSSSNTAYDRTYDVTINGLDWNVPGNQNFDGYVRIGGGKSSQLNNTDRIIYSKSPMTDAINKITFNHNGKNADGITINSITLTVASDPNFNSIIETISLTPTIQKNTSGSFDYTPTSGEWATNSYYKFAINVTNTSGSNYGINVSSIVFYKHSAGAVDPAVSFASESVTVKEGKTVTNELTKPSDLAVTYSSNDESIATVASDGTVTGIAPGTATITASWNAVTGQYNAGSKSYTVTVEEAVAVAPEVSFESESATVKVGKTVTNALTKPEDLSVAFTSGNESIATVDADGVVTGVAEGETTITVSWDAVDKAYTAGSKSYTLTVTAAGGEETLVEGFEKAEASSTYNSTKTYTANESDCGIGWQMYYGCVSTNDKIDGSNSAQMRYYASASTNLPYIMTTTPIEGLNHIAFKARVSDTSIKFNVSYSTDGTNWTDIATDEQLTAAGASGVTEFEYDIPSGGQYIKIGFSGNTTVPSSNNIRLLIDNVTFTSNTASGPVDPVVTVDESLTVEVGNSVTPEISAPNGLTFTYTSEDENIATVNSEGMVTGVAVGNTTITIAWAAVAGKYNAGQKAISVSVIEPAPATVYYKVTSNKQLYPGNEYILVAENAQMAMGESGTNTFRAAVEVEISSGSTISITKEAVAVLTLGGSTGAWTFQPSDSEEVLGLKSDSNRLDNMEDHSLWSITNDFQVVNNDFDRYIQYNSGASRFAAYKNTQAKSVLYVKEGYTESEKETATVEISSTEITAGLYSAVISTTPEGLVVTYSSDNPDVADVTPDGIVDGYSEGTANITVAWEDQTVDGVEYYGGSKIFEVTVSLSQPNISISSTSLNLDDATTATITLEPEDLQATYASSDEGVATVANGIVTAVGAGTATITVSWEAQKVNNLPYGAGTQTFEITVSDDRPVQCVFEEEYYTRFDLSVNGWGLPEKSTNITQSGSYENSGKTITLEGDPGFYYNTSGFILLGKTGATLTLPAFGFDVMAIEVTGASGASPNINQNIFVGETAVSTETTGAKGTNLYFIDEDYQSAGNIYTIKVNNSYNTQFTEIKVYKKDAFVELSVSDAGYRTYCDADALDFNVASDGLKAYIVEGVDAAGSTNLVLKEVGKVPAETGVLLEAEEGTYYVALASAKTEEESSDFDDVSTNQLIGVTESTEVEPSIIVLMNGENGIGFYKTSKTFTVGAHTAYLPINTLKTVADAGADGVKTLNINADNDTPTGINCINAAELSGKDAVIYNLKGQRVSRAIKGIYIVNGKKVMVK